MDGLSSAASAFAVVSLAAQVASGIQKLCDFWQSVRDGPKDVLCIVRDLEVVSIILDEMRQEAHGERPHSRALATTIEALESCNGSVAALNHLIDELQPGFTSKKRALKKRAALKAAWKGDMIRKFRETLKDMKLTLLLAKQNSIEHSTTIRDNDRQLDLEAIAHGMRLLLMQKSQTMNAMASTNSLNYKEHIQALREECQIMSARIANPVGRYGAQSLTDSALSEFSAESATDKIEDLVQNKLRVPLPKKTPAVKYSRVRARGNFAITGLFGTLHMTSSVITNVTTSSTSVAEEGSDDEGRSQLQTIITIHPSRWLSTIGLMLGIQIIMSQSLRGLDCRARTYRAVPDDSRVFSLCRSGDIDMIQQLFDRGQASPWDTDSRGLTPLFFAARARQLDVCKLLINQGADVDARTLTNDSVASYACLKECQLSEKKSCEEHIEVLRLFLDNLDFSDDINCTGLWGLRRLLITAKCNHGSCSHARDHPTAFLWAFSLLKSDISLAIPAMARGIAQLINQAVKLDDVGLLSLLIRVAGNINSRELLKWFSPAHNLVMSKPQHEIRQSDRFLISHGLDLHVVMDEEFKESAQYHYSSGESPLSCAMRHSFSFSLFRSLLRDMDIYIEHFIDQELKEHCLQEASWTRTTLLRLFALDYPPLEMPMIVCRTCGWDDVAAESTWLSVLEKLKSTPETIYNAEEIVLARKMEISKSEDIVGTTCHLCKAAESRTTFENSDEEDSMFLFPLTL